DGLTVNATKITSGTLANARLSAQVARTNLANVFEQDQSILGSGVISQTLEGNTTVSSIMVANDANADEKRWHWQSGGVIGSGVLRLRMVNDAISNGANAMVLSRTGIASCDVSFPIGKASLTGVAVAYSAKTAAYTLTKTDSVVSGDATAAAFSITLPTAVGVTGQIYIIKKIDSSVNVVTIATSSSQTIDGAATVFLSTQWQTTRVVSDGANWLII
ncbi:MAG TPA: hypothetical protein VM260_12310, partial [Pirellula sp.]|nr:hypothetical protein [Pirellula sp.]